MHPNLVGMSAFIIIGWQNKSVARKRIFPKCLEQNGKNARKIAIATRIIFTGPTVEANVTRMAQISKRITSVFLFFEGIISAFP